MMWMGVDDVDGEKAMGRKDAAHRMIITKVVFCVDGSNNATHPANYILQE